MVFNDELIEKFYKETLGAESIDKYGPIAFPGFKMEIYGEEKIIPPYTKIQNGEEKLAYWRVVKISRDKINKVPEKIKKLL